MHWVNYMWLGHTPFSDKVLVNGKDNHLLIGSSVWTLIALFNSHFNTISQIILSLLRMKASYSVMLKVYSWRFRNPPKTNMSNADRRLRGSFCRSPQHLKDRQKVPDSLSQSIPVTSRKYWPACGTTMSFICNAFYHTVIRPNTEMLT